MPPPPTLNVKGNVSLTYKAEANLAFTGENSSMTGKITATSNKSSIGFTDGSTWNASGSSKINDLTLDHAVINMDEAGSKIEVVKSASGTGASINMKVEVEENGAVRGSSVKFANADEGMRANVNYIGVTSDDMTKDDFENLTAASISGVDGAAYVEQGDVNGAYRSIFTRDGSVSTTEAENTKLFDFRGANAIALIQWRNQINHLTKRLGDLRASTGAYGAWARVYGKESEWGQGVNNINMQSTTIEVGGDARVGEWIVGGALNYTDTDLDLVNGSGDGDIYGAALYASRLFENGSFIDLIGRYGHLINIGTK